MLFHVKRNKWLLKQNHFHQSQVRNKLQQVPQLGEPNNKLPLQEIVNLDKILLLIKSPKILLFRVRSIKMLKKLIYLLDLRVLVYPTKEIIF